MNGVDYSKQLARERDHYQNTIQKDRAHSEKRIEAEQERHDNIQAKQREVFDRDRKELESDYKTNISDIKERTGESIDNIKDRFHKQNKVEQERFHEERSVSKKDFDGRMRDIKSSYDRAFRNERNGNESIQETKAKRYDDNVERLLIDPVGGLLRGYDPAGDLPRSVAFDSTLQARLTSVGKAFPNQSLRLQSWSADLSRMVFYASGGTDQVEDFSNHQYEFIHCLLSGLF